MPLPFFERPSVNFLLGPFLSKKTWLALDLAVSLASGSRWPEETAENVMTAADIMRAFSPMQPGNPSPPKGLSYGLPALFIDEYHGLDELSRRIRTLFQARHLPPNIPLHYMSLPLYNLTNPQDTAALEAQARSLGAGLIVFDQPYCLPHLDVGRGTSFLSLHPLMSSLQALAASLNAAVLVLLNVPTRRARSSFASALSALGVDHILALDFFPTDRPDKATPDNKLLDRCQSGYLHLRTITHGDLCQLSTVSCHLKIRATDHHYSLSLTSGPPDPSTSRLTNFQPPLGPASLAVLRYLAAAGSASTRVLMENVTAAVPTRVRTLIHELARDGYIICTKRGGAHHPATYALTPSGRSML